jgi:acetyl esterase/lipase
VVLFPAVPYGPKPRHLIDIYVPSHVYEQLQEEQLLDPQQQQQRRRQEQGFSQEQQQQQRELAPVVFFCHGGIWATGEASSYKAVQALVGS